MKLHERPLLHLEHHLEHRVHSSNSGWKALATGIMGSSLVTLGFVQALFAMNIPITVILPTTAPIWVGIATMVFMCIKE